MDTLYWSWICHMMYSQLVLRPIQTAFCIRVHIMVAMLSKLIQCKLLYLIFFKFVHFSHVSLRYNIFVLFRSKREIVDKIEIPTRYITAPAFGGPNLDILFVTTASLPMDFRTGVAGKPLPPPAGYVFQVPMNVTGIPTYLPRVWFII